MLYLTANSCRVCTNRWVGKINVTPLTVESATGGQCIQFSGAPWYVAQMTAGTERRLQLAFTRIGVRTYLPVHRTHRSRATYQHVARDYIRRDYVARLPMFPGYLFAQLGETEWSRVKLQLGTALKPKWVNFGDGPVEVGVDLLEMIASGNGDEDHQYIRAPYMAGDTIEITSGPLIGMQAIFSHDANERVFALINLLGRQKMVEFELAQTRAFDS